jgi:hypothetical protein
MLSDFVGRRVRGEARWSEGRGEDEAGATADQRREDEVRAAVTALRNLPPPGYETLLLGQATRD